MSTITPLPTRIFLEGNIYRCSLTPLDGTILQMPTTGTAFSVGARVTLRAKNTTVQSDNHCIAYADLNFGTNKGGAFYVHATDGTLIAVLGNTTYTSTSVFTYNTEHQLTFTVDTTTTLKAYIDGTLVWTQTIVRKAVNGLTDNHIGTESVAFNGLYGTIRDAFVSKTLLSQSDVTSIQTGTYPTLGAHWKMDEGAGFACADVSGNGNTLMANADTNNSPVIYWKRSGRSICK